MSSLILIVAIFCAVFAAVQITSVALAIVRLRRKAPPQLNDYPPVSLVRPLCGIDNYAADTLRSTFELDYPRYEILFCVADTADPVLPLVSQHGVHCAAEAPPLTETHDAFWFPNHLRFRAKLLQTASAELAGATVY